MLHRVMLTVLAGLFAAAAVADPIEDYFLQRGPLATVKDTSTGPGNDFTLYTPADPGANGVRHPVITWGNGTFTTPSFYDGFLDPSRRTVSW